MNIAVGFGCLVIVAVLKGSTAGHGACNCIYGHRPEGCLLDGNKLAGWACQCTINHYGPDCTGQIVPCRTPDTPACNSAGYSYADCMEGVENGRGNCCGYQDATVNCDVSNRYEFEADDGINVVASGQAGSAGQSNEEGSYSYTSSDGTLVQVSYRCDELGCVYESPLIPQAPPHVAELLRIAEEQRAAGITFN